MKEKKELENQLCAMIGKAKESLSAARELNKKQHYDDAASRAYYAAFHALQAVLLTKGLSFSKHSAVLSSFNKEFIHAKIFPKNFFDKVMRLFQHRQAGDYEYEVAIEREESMRDLDDVELIIQAIQAFLKRENYLDQ